MFALVENLRQKQRLYISFYNSTIIVLNVCLRRVSLVKAKIAYWFYNSTRCLLLSRILGKSKDRVVVFILVLNVGLCR